MSNRSAQFIASELTVAAITLSDLAAGQRDKEIRERLLPLEWEIWEKSDPNDLIVAMMNLAVFLIIYIINCFPGPLAVIAFIGLPYLARFLALIVCA
jgi:hypothetical protein